MEKTIKAPASKLTTAGLVIAWIASIGFALEMKNLLTPGNYPIGTDPSFDISAAVLAFLLILFGGILAWRGSLVRNNAEESFLGRFLGVAAIINSILLALMLIITALLFSANLAFMRQYIQHLVDEPKPDYSYPSFPTPADLRPTPVYDPSSVNIAGPIQSSIDGLRVGEISLSLNSDSTQIETILIQLDRINCDVQKDGVVTTYAVAQTKTLIHGPIKLENDDFYVSQIGEVLHGIVTQGGQGHGTIYLQFTDATRNQTCDLGNFEWSASRLNQ